MTGPQRLKYDNDRIHYLTTYIIEDLKAKNKALRAENKALREQLRIEREFTRMASSP